ncbi:hypothetical protein MtrunA17_Chr1g0183371 [Medicago truncatula]|uniref:Uncharacterized protein n=1 Tax=Medicago truncatula TaxID=3880 RepID=A0A396JT95_MEDTR|nr:hypothetical protein MtrunA17_Chr1g0183371 [Medicago truncatula]
MPLIIVTVGTTWEQFGTYSQLLDCEQNNARKPILLEKIKK